MEPHDQQEASAPVYAHFKDRDFARADESDSDTSSVHHSVMLSPGSSPQLQPGSLPYGPNPALVGMAKAARSNARASSKAKKKAAAGAKKKKQKKSSKRERISALGQEF